MHPALTLTILTTILALSNAQVTFNRTTFTFNCPSTPQNGTYCTGPSLRSSIIIRCAGTTGIAGNCNDNLVGVPPIGVKGFAQCYQTTPTSGTAACSYNGTVYPESGRPSFPIPRNTNNNNSHTDYPNPFLPPPFLPDTPSSSSAAPTTTRTNADPPPYPIPPNSTTVLGTATAPTTTSTAMTRGKSGPGTSTFRGGAARNWTKASEGVQMVAVGLVMVLLEMELF